MAKHLLPVVFERIRRRREAFGQDQPAALCFFHRAGKLRIRGGGLQPPRDDDAQVFVYRHQAAVEGAVVEGVEA